MKVLSMLPELLMKVLRNLFLRCEKKIAETYDFGNINEVFIDSES